MNKKITVKIICKIIFSFFFAFLCCFISWFMNRCGFLIYGFFYTYFILPLVISLFCYLIYKNFIKLKLIHQIKQDVTVNLNNILESESATSKNIRYGIKLFLILDLCCIVVFSLISIHTPLTPLKEIDDNTIPFGHLIEEKGTETSVSTTSHLQLFDCSVFSCIETNNDKTIVISKEGAIHCPKTFIDSYYAYFSKNDIHYNHKYTGNIQSFSTETWSGEYFISENKKEICYILRNEHSFISIRVLSDTEQQSTGDG